jgi:hypothetical protein
MASAQGLDMDDVDARQADDRRVRDGPVLADTVIAILRDRRSRPHMVHLHLLVNHIPIEGSFIVLLFLVWGLLRREEAVTRAALFGAFLIAIATLLVFFTGDAAADALSSATWLSKELVERHDDRAGITVGAALVMGAIAGFALWGSKPVRPRVAWLACASLGVTFLLASWTAVAGGVIRHEEIRGAAHPQ